ncbi:lipopolysaccharide core biosynthesis protein LpsA, partial [Campylobacter upsaliensis]|nr:lipopolysaccharide core biosynthesis protein LpsA [Campylobacter upsaliensis]
MRNSRLATRLSHLAYNIKGITRMMSPRFLLARREDILRALQGRSDVDMIKKRVDYYCQMDTKITLDEDAKNIASVRFARKSVGYKFDSYEYLRYFPQDFKAHFEFGDVSYICTKPSLTKSR